MVTSLYAGILGLIYICLSAYVILGRFKYKVNLGDGANEDMFKRIRVHANFIEYVPIALILMILAEVEGISEMIIHILGISLIISRIFHALSISKILAIPMGRQIGMMMTFLVIIVSAILCIKSYFIF